MVMEPLLDWPQVDPWVETELNRGEFAGALPSIIVNIAGGPPAMTQSAIGTLEVVLLIGIPAVKDQLGISHLEFWIDHITSNWLKPLYADQVGFPFWNPLISNCIGPGDPPFRSWYIKDKFGYTGADVGVGVWVGVWVGVGVNGNKLHIVVAV